MPRSANQFYNQSPYPTDNSFAPIADGLARALFGDPEAAAAQQQQQREAELLQAQTQRQRSAAGYDDSRTAGVNIQNRASMSLPELFAQMQPPTVAPSAPIMEGDPGQSAGLDQFLGGLAQQDANQNFDGDAAIRKMLPQLLAATGQMQGDKINPNDMVASLASMFGSDEMARRGMVNQGKTPGEEFALTSGRADEVAQQGYSAKLAEALGVANIQAGSSRYGADSRASASRDVAGIRAGATRYTADAKNSGSFVSDGRSAALSVYPNLQITDNVRDPNSDLGKANPGSLHNSTRAAVDSRAIPGMTFDQYVQGYRDKGYEIREAIDEYKNPSGHATAGHWHVVLGQKKGSNSKASTASKTPKPVPLHASKEIKTTVAEYLKGLGNEKFQTPRVTTTLIAAVEREYQRTQSVAVAMRNVGKNFISGVDRINKRKAAGGKAASNDGWGELK
jgi:hypothetical protein